MEDTGLGQEAGLKAGRGGRSSMSLRSLPLALQVSRLESFWALRVVCPEQLTALLAWIREPWEELFSIGLRTVTQETLDLDR